MIFESVIFELCVTSLWPICDICDTYFEHFMTFLDLKIQITTDGCNGGTPAIDLWQEVVGAVFLAFW